jgi:HD-GYP domain-containing protein (c-di-GMP phosphodiesterase class II)
VYRPALSFDEARDELRRCAGSQFDPVVVVALLEELENPARRLTIVANDDDAVHQPIAANS